MSVDEKHRKEFEIFVKDKGITLEAFGQLKRKGEKVVLVK